MKLPIVLTALVVAVPVGNVSAFMPGSVSSRPALLFRTSSSSLSSTLAPPTTTTDVDASSPFPFQSYDPKSPEGEIRSLFTLWNDAVVSGDAKKVTSRYTKDAILFPMVSDAPRTDLEAINTYYDGFLLKQPKAEILDGYVKIGKDWAQDNGVYEFTMGADGTKVKARYSFVYMKEGGKWKIAHHHSSRMPEGIAVATPIDKQEVRNLFHLWNDALATLDPTVVANRYSKDAVLLPTVSDTPRNSKEGITEYFTAFLKLKPQGKILESYVHVGTNWCKDSGIYEFTMGATGAVVKARYTFVYIYEDKQWKVYHQHSSQMPEEIEPKRVPNSLSDDDVRGLFSKWTDALATNDPAKVAALYSKQAILLPAVSDEPRQTKKAIASYYADFMKNKPKCVITEGVVRSGDNWAKDAGVYEFTMAATGEKIRARYSFVYAFEDGEWKIAHHHSSVMPEGYLAVAKEMSGEILSEEETRAMFHRWNNALATLDPNTVADLYAKNPILLPTVSDQPRRTRESIVDYFTSFLKLKPQGVVTKSVTLSGPNWAEDAGVYEFTMGADGSKVLARYSFTYVKEDGVWKIAHHHSSAMPEGMMLAASKVKALEEILMS